MSETAKLIVFEGADAAGKSAISAGVCDAIRRRGTPVRTFSFPGKTPHTLGDLVYRIHHNSRAFGIESLTPASLQSLHIAAHLDAIESTILPLLRQGTSVVLDRFWWSTFVYGVADGISRDVLNALIEAERILWAERPPTVLFYVTRQRPLRQEDDEEWRRRNEIYRDLLMAEKEKYPIYVIENEGSLQTAISTALALIIPNDSARANTTSSH
jgi:thymidylate kinase